MFIGLYGIDLVASGPESPLCNRLLDPANPLAMGAPFSEPALYNFGLDPNWNEGPCSVDNGMEDCLTRVYTSAVFDESAGKRTGRLVILEGWGHFPAAASRTEDDLIEHNPFMQSWQMPIEELTVTFRGIGRDKVVATCFFDNYDEQDKEFILPITFNTYVVEPTE